VNIELPGDVKLEFIAKGNAKQAVIRLPKDAIGGVTCLCPRGLDRIGSEWGNRKNGPGPLKLPNFRGPAGQA